MPSGIFLLKIINKYILESHTVSQHLYTLTVYPAGVLSEESMSASMEHPICTLYKTV